MPKPGNVIRLTGVNLYDKAKVFFPSSTGEKEGFVQSASSDATSMDVLVPDGVGDKAGYIRIESEGADVEVKGIVMFYKQGVFYIAVPALRQPRVPRWGRRTAAVRIAASRLRASGCAGRSRGRACLLYTSRCV